MILVTSVTSGRAMFTTSDIDTPSAFTEITSSEYHTFIQNLANSVFYIIVAFVVFFGLFVGIYFYKHCIKRNVSNCKTVDTFASQLVRYKSCYRDSLQNQPIRHTCATEPAYLEPVTNAHYDEINNFDESDNQWIASASTVRERI